MDPVAYMLTETNNTRKRKKPRKRKLDPKKIFITPKTKPKSK